MKPSQEFENGNKSGQTLRLLAYLQRKLNKKPFVLSNYMGLKKHDLTKVFKSGNAPKVSIIIPTRDKPDLLSKCVDSVRNMTKYPNYEIIIVNNMSSESTTLSLLANYGEHGITVLDFAEPFNYSKICNFAAANASGQFICFLNNDTEVLYENWLSSMVDHAIQDTTGVVGAVLTYPDGSIQHMGIALGYTGVAGHPGRGNTPAEILPSSCYEVSGVTFACAVVSKTKFQEIGGLDESFPFGYNDVDFCVRSAKAGYKNIICLEARSTHSESQTRKKTLTFTGAIQAFKDVMAFLRKNRTNFEERFFSAKAYE
jgi:GT2 family glycosyltransferase